VSIVELFVVLICMDYRYLDGCFPVFKSIVTISNPDSPSISETGITPGLRI
jgi:hypothetical protein